MDKQNEMTNHFDGKEYFTLFKLVVIRILYVTSITVNDQEDTLNYNVSYEDGKCYEEKKRKQMDQKTF